MPVYQVAFREPIPVVRAEEPTWDYVKAKILAFGTWDTLPEAAREAAREAWAAEAPEIADVWTVIPSIEAIHHIRDTAKRWRAEAAAAEKAVPEMVLEVLRTWTLEDATKVVGKRTVREVEREWTEGRTTKRTYRTHDVDLTAIEALVNATGLASGKSPWHYLNLELSGEGIEPEIWEYVSKRFWQERS